MTATGCVSRSLDKCLESKSPQTDVSVIARAAFWTASSTLPLAFACRQTVSSGRTRLRSPAASARKVEVEVACEETG